MTDMGKEYGCALFSLAKEEGKTREYADSLNIIDKAFADNPEYVDLLSSPNISKKELTALIDRAFSNVLTDNVLSFLKLLCEKGNILYFSKAKEKYDSLFDNYRNITTATVTCAEPLSTAEKARLVEKLEKISGRTVNCFYRQDPTLLGGITVEIDGKVIDGSLKSRLREIKGVIQK